MRNVDILVDGDFYLNLCKDQSDDKKVVKGLTTHCLKHIDNPAKS
jgi:hypothetical protein